MAYRPLDSKTQPQVWLGLFVGMVCVGVRQKHIVGARASFFWDEAQKIIGQVAKRAPSQKDCPRCGRLVLSLDAWQQNLGEVVGLEFGRGVGFAVFADQYVLDLAIGVAVAGRKLDKLNGRVHGVG